MTADAIVSEKAATSYTPQINVRDVINLTARLAQLLAEEVDLLGDMKVKKIEALQQEKHFLINALNTQRKLLDKHPQLVDTIPSQDSKDLEDVVNLFNDILQENHRKLLLAKEVNHKIVQAITEVVKEGTLSKVYDGSGINAVAPYETLSVTLNQTI
ncbi:MAG: hypothetical protein SFT92_03680 [Rickettsiales bacterium]|nr:hypothetical protein [Rickettsiales bacterium]